MINIINSTYEKLFCLYFLEVSPLLAIDEMLNKAMGKVTEDEFSLSSFLEDFDTSEKAKDPAKRYEIGSAFVGLSNFRLLSKAHAERLDADDYAVFEQMISDSNEENFKRALDIVRNTFKKVMSVNPDETEKMTCLGPYPDEKFCFDDDSIVLGLVINDPDLPEGTIAKIETVAQDLKEELFADISKEIEAKIELFVSVE